MYKCEDCGREFDEPDIITETHGLSSPPFEKVAVCPYCNSTDYSDAIEDEEDE